VKLRKLVTSATAVCGAAVVVVALAAPALAYPATVARYPTPASATQYSGAAFDTCTAPPVSALTGPSASTSAASIGTVPSPS